MVAVLHDSCVRNNNAYAASLYRQYAFLNPLFLMRVGIDG